MSQPDRHNASKEQCNVENMCGDAPLERGQNMIAIIDYGAGNLFSVKNALEHLGIENKITASADCHSYDMAEMRQILQIKNSRITGNFIKILRRMGVRFAFLVL